MSPAAREAMGNPQVIQTAALANRDARLTSWRGNDSLVLEGSASAAHLCGEKTTRGEDQPTLGAGYLREAMSTAPQGRLAPIGAYFYARTRILHTQQK